MKILVYSILGLLILGCITLVISYLLSGKPSIITNHVIIQKPQETVFDFVADMRNELKWNPDVQFMDKLTEGPIGFGTRFKAKWHLSDTIEVEITHYERPDYITFVNGGPLEVTLDLNLMATDGSTELKTKFIATPRGFLRAIFPIIKRKLKSQEKENMVNLKKSLENKKYNIEL